MLRRAAISAARAQRAISQARAASTISGASADGKLSDELSSKVRARPGEDASCAADPARGRAAAEPAEPADS